MPRRAGSFSFIVSTVMLAMSGCASSDDVTAVASRRSQLTPIVVTLPLDTTSEDAGGLASEPPTGSFDIEPVPARPDLIVETADPRPTTIAVVGDSLTVSASDEIESALGAGGFDIVDIDGLESRRMTHGSDALAPGVDAVAEIIARSQPDLWVIALGTNDVASVGDLGGFRAQMRSILDLLPPDVPVIWVDLWIRERNDSIVEANRLIRTELRSWSGGATVVDWYAHGLDEGVITGDGVHLTEVGQQLFADSIVVAIDEMFTRGTSRSDPNG